MDRDFLLRHDCRREAGCAEIVLLPSFTQGTSELLTLGEMSYQAAKI